MHQLSHTNVCRQKASVLLRGGGGGGGVLYSQRQQMYQAIAWVAWWAPPAVHAKQQGAKDRTAANPAITTSANLGDVAAHKW